MKKIIGVDGGGTKTEFVVCNEFGICLKRVVLSSGNPVDIGMERLFALLEKGIGCLLSSFDEKTADSLFAGISGGSAADNKEKIYDFLLKIKAAKVFDNGSDAVNVISMGVEDDDGIALIAGTGSVAFAKKKNEIKRIGGWGYFFDGAGGGFDFGREALSAVYKYIDGTGEYTLLKELIENKLGEGADKALAKIYEGGKRYIAAFAPQVFEAYKQGDSVAERIVKRNTGHWINLIKTAEKWVQTEKVVFAGSIFKQEEILLPLIKDGLDKKINPVIPKLPPVYGAVREAMKLCGMSCTERIKENFINSYKSFK